MQAAKILPSIGEASFQFAPVGVRAGAGAHAIAIRCHRILECVWHELDAAARALDEQQQ